MSAVSCTMPPGLTSSEAPHLATSSWVVGLYGAISLLTQLGWVLAHLVKSLCAPLSPHVRNRLPGSSKGKAEALPYVLHCTALSAFSASCFMVFSNERR